MSEMTDAGYRGMSSDTRDGIPQDNMVYRRLRARAIATIDTRDGIPEPTEFDLAVWGELEKSYRCQQPDTAAASLIRLIAAERRAREEAERRADGLLGRIQAMGGYHARSAREIEIAEALGQTPEKERDPADHAIGELLLLVDVGRNRLDLAEQRAEEVEAWKESATAVEQEWDCQAVAKELELPLGCSIRREILPAVKSLKDRLAAAEQQVADLRAALATIGEWDCLNPPRADLLADLPWLRQVVDEALGAFIPSEPIA